VDGAACLLEQQGARKIVDTTFMFMAGFTFDTETNVEDMGRYLRRSSVDLGLAPAPYSHYYTCEIPQRSHDLIDVRAFGPDERTVFLPYIARAYEQSPTVNARPRALRALARDRTERARRSREVGRSCLARIWSVRQPRDAALSPGR
jgi:hypothetical protein